MFEQRHEVSVLRHAEEIMGHAQIIVLEPTGALLGTADWQAQKRRPEVWAKMSKEGSRLAFKTA